MTVIAIPLYVGVIYQHKILFNNNNESISQNDKEKELKTTVENKTLNQKNKDEMNLNQKNKNEVNLNNSIKFNLKSMEKYRSNEYLSWYDQMNLSYSIKNNTNKDILAIKGKLKIYDSFNELVTTYEIKEDVTIKSNKIKDFNDGYSLNQYSDSYSNIINLNKPKYIFEVKQIIY